VIFLTRTGSLQPWTLDLPRQETIPLLQEILTCSCEGGGGPDSVAVVGAHEGRVAALLRRVAAVQRQRLLLTIPFTTIFEYLQASWGLCGPLEGSPLYAMGWGSLPAQPCHTRPAPTGCQPAAALARGLGAGESQTPSPPARPTGPNPAAAQHLRSVAQAAAPLDGGCMFYLAAAVSDFYIPWASLVGRAATAPLPCAFPSPCLTGAGFCGISGPARGRAGRGGGTGAGIARPAPAPLHP
jgi:hypothetical protein